MSDLQLLHGEAYATLRSFPSESVDAVITDPPYSSGGFTRSDRTQRTNDKYAQQGHEGRFADFTGDNRDQRSYLAWCSLWMSECLRIVKPSGYLLTFTDWRQLPVTADAIQAGGWVWRGIVSWDKGGSARAPSTGWFRHQCEYVVWGTKGVTKPAAHGGPFPGAYTVRQRRSERFHLTSKPVDLMEQLVQIVPPGGTVLDPFAGSGTTLVACQRQGRRGIGIEMSPHYHEVARRRLGADAAA